MTRILASQSSPHIRFWKGGDAKASSWIARLGCATLLLVSSANCAVAEPIETGPIARGHVEASAKKTPGVVALENQDADTAEERAQDDVEEEKGQDTDAQSPAEDQPAQDAEPPAEAKEKLPNIILILADDLGWGDLKSYSMASKIPTPNIDKLVASGMKFTDAHSPSSVCTPTRYGIMTGQYAWRTQPEGRAIKYFDPPLIEPRQLTLPELLRNQRYATAAFGKWHLGLNISNRGGIGFARIVDDKLPKYPDFTATIQGGPLDHGFDTWFGAQLKLVRAFVKDRKFVGKPRLGPEKEDFRVKTWDESRKGPIQLTAALEYLQESQAERPDKPFFLYFASQSPHPPYTPPKSINGMPIEGTSNAGPRGDLIVELDFTVGRLMRELENLGITKDTLVILTSDNGPDYFDEHSDHDAAGGWRGEKGSIYEAGHHIPLIAHWGDGTEEGSKIKPGTVCQYLIGLQDLMATFADVTGAEMPTGAARDSISFLPLLLGEPDVEPPRKHIVHHSARGEFAIRRGPWKLILPVRDESSEGEGENQRPFELYNLNGDRHEQDNLYAEEPEIVAELKALFESVKK